MALTRPRHLFVSESDGNMYDLRLPNWHTLPPLRPNYERGHRKINSVADLKAVLRHGPYAWPGGYPMYFIVNDGEALSFAAVREQFRQIADAVHHKINNGWRVMVCEINYEDTDLVCAHTNRPIEAAIGEN